VAIKLGLPRSEEVARGAAESADLSKLIWLRTKQHCHFPFNITASAATAGSVQMLQWLKKRGFLLRDYTSVAAASRPHSMPVLRYLHESGCEWHKDCCGKAGAAGDVAQLQRLCSHGAVLSLSSVYEAARGGSVPVFEFLQQQQEVAVNMLSSKTLLHAALHGQLQLCKWLRAAGCDWDHTVCTAAAGRYHIGTLRWLHEHGCPWDAAAICRQSVYGSVSSIDVLQYVLDAGELVDAALLTELLLQAGTFRKLVAAKWLRQHGAQWPS
jgi:hypothetical protein